MRRKDRERDRSFAWEVLKKAPYATLSLTDGQGRPYAVPVNQAVDEEYHVVYFHCAGAGEKWELLKDGAEVCLSAVSHATAVPNAFTMAYASTCRVWDASLRTLCSAFSSLSASLSMLMALSRACLRLSRAVAK